MKNIEIAIKISIQKKMLTSPITLIAKKSVPEKEVLPPY